MCLDQYFLILIMYTGNLLYINSPWIRLVFNSFNGRYILNYVYKCVYNCICPFWYMYWCTVDEQLHGVIQSLVDDT